MQLMLIAGITFAIGAVMFALQNNVPVTVAFALWRFDSTLAVVLLVAMGLGALIAGLVSTPTVIRGQWVGARQRRQMATLEEDKNALAQRIVLLEQELARLQPAGVVLPQEPRPYVGLKTLLAGGKADEPKA